VSDSRAPRRQVVSAAQAMRAGGLVCSTLGNVSARWADGMLITPTRRHPDDLPPEDLVELAPEEGVAQSGAQQASLEWRVHAAIYRDRPDVGAIVHTHSPHATARGFVAAPLVVETEEHRYFGLIGSRSLGRRRRAASSSRVPPFEPLARARPRSSPAMLKSRPDQRLTSSSSRRRQAQGVRPPVELGVEIGGVGVGDERRGRVHRAHADAQATELRDLVGIVRK